jgi:hypothetical protein
MLGALLAPFFLAACISPVPYVDPKYDAAPVTLPADVEGMQTALDVEFYTNGKRKTGADKALRKLVTEALVARGVVIVDDGSAPVEMNVSVNNVADLGDAASSGFGTGLTLGLAGSTVTDFYKADIRIESEGQTFEHSYDHAVHSTIGRVKEPPIPGLQPQANLQSAISAVIADIIDQALYDYFAEQAAAETADDSADVGS